MTTPAQPAEQDPDLQTRARAQLMIGAAIVMGACVFGGLTAVVLMALGQRVPAGGVAVVAGAGIIVGVAVQVAAIRKLKPQQKSDVK